MAVDHRQAVAVVQRQRGGGAVVLADAQVVGDGLGVGLEVVVRQPDQFGRAGGAGGAQQQRQVGVEVVRGDRAPFVQAQPARGVGAHHDVGVVGGGQGPYGRGVVAGDQQDRVAGAERGQVGDQHIGRVGGGQQHQAPSAAEARGRTGDLFGQPAIRQFAVRGDQGRTVAVGGEACGEPGGCGARDVGQQVGGGEHRRILGLPYLKGKTQKHHGRCMGGAQVRGDPVEQRSLSSRS